MRRAVTLFAIAALVPAGCSPPDATGPSGDAAFSRANGFGPAASARYEVTITNLTDGQPFTPPVVVTHRPALELFTAGRPASMQVQQIAENGNLGPMLQVLGDAKHVADFGLAFGPTADPLLPGESTSLVVRTEKGAFALSWISMLICTNDGFTGSDGLALPRHPGESVTATTAAYDAGTEINTEDFEDLVPPCPALTGVPSDVPGTGTSDPALAEGGVIHRHPGIAGIADLVPGIHGWTNPVARVTVRRIE